jgi:hypothetical protein
MKGNDLHKGAFIIVLFYSDLELDEMKETAVVKFICMHNIYKSVGVFHCADSTFICGKVAEPLIRAALRDTFVMDFYRTYCWGTRN